MLTAAILSRGRSQIITTHRFFPNALLVCPDTERDLYHKRCPDSKIVEIPEAVHGLGAVRNWVLDNISGDVVMIDDDMKRCFYIAAEDYRYFDDTEQIWQIVENCWINATDAGAMVFGFNQTWDMRKYTPCEPFLLNSWLGNIVGVIGRNPEVRFTEVNKGKVDIDFCLTNLLVYRKVWIDNRYAFSFCRDNNAGGSSEFRTATTVTREMEYLKRKWGKYIQFSSVKTKESIKLKVPRKQDIYI